MTNRLPEQKARQKIDQQLKAAGWVVQDLKTINLSEQHLIVAEVKARTTAIDHLGAELDRQITRFNRMRQSTRAAAFSGNLIPND